MPRRGVRDTGVRARNVPTYRTVKEGPSVRDMRGRQGVTTTMIDALIEQRPALDRSTIDTDRADNTVLTILDPVAVSDEHTFRWGDPPHIYKIKAVDGLLKDEESGVRFSSEVTVLR